jgi:hypothetical protein
MFDCPTNKNRWNFSFAGSLIASSAGENEATRRATTKVRR